jgi:hypothetical protein
VTKASSPTVAPTSGGSGKFIEEGAASYVQATIAIKEFARIVHEECEKVALDFLDDINRVMGTRLSEDDLDQCRKGKLLDPRDPWLCVYFSIKDIGWIYLGLYWQSVGEGGYKLHGAAMIWFRDKKLFECAREKFKGVEDSRIELFPYGEEDDCLTVSESIPIEQAASFPHTLHSVLSGFLEAWESIGGLDGLKPPAPSP